MLVRQFPNNIFSLNLFTVELLQSMLVPNIRSCLNDARDWRWFNLAFIILIPIESDRYTICIYTAWHKNNILVFIFYTIKILSKYIFYVIFSFFFFYFFLLTYCKQSHFNVCNLTLNALNTCKYFCIYCRNGNSFRLFCVSNLLWKVFSPKRVWSFAENANPGLFIDQASFKIQHKWRTWEEWGEEG